MAELPLSFRLVMQLRRVPWLHRPLHLTKRFFTGHLKVFVLDLLRVVVPAKWVRFGPPKGTFSIYNARRCEPVVPSRIVLRDQGAPPVTEKSLQVISRLNQHSCQPWPIFWSEHKAARLTGPSLALMDDQKHLCVEAIYGDFCVRYDPSYRTMRLPRETRLDGNWTSLVSRWCPNGGVPAFSHWIMDGLPRLALLAEFPPDTRIIVPAKLAAYQKETLTLLGLLDRCRHTPETHVRVERYFFSSPTAMIACYNPHGWNFLRASFLPKADAAYSGPRKFIIHRDNKARGLQNEREVYDYFRGLGWEIIDTEKLTFAQELKLFMDADAIAGVFGSGFTNTLWCKPGCKVICFVPDAFIDGYLEGIAHALGLEFHFHIFPSDHAARALVDLNVVKRMLVDAREL